MRWNLTDEQRFMLLEIIGYMIKRADIYGFEKKEYREIYDDIHHASLHSNHVASIFDSIQTFQEELSKENLDKLCAEIKELTTHTAS